MELDDEETALRGYAEVHAALASVLWVERPGQRDRAEQQWAIAMAFDKRFADPEFVAVARHWPPRMLTALQRFLELK